MPAYPKPSKRRRDGPPKTMPKKLVDLVLARDEGVCMIGAPGCLGVANCADHRTGRGMGGNPPLNVVYNLVAACSPCNGLKESDATVARDCEARGIKLRRSQSTIQDLRVALSRPVVDRSGMSWQLLEDGTRHPEPPF